MSKLPAFQFYPADWRKDPGVQALNYHDRGVWFEMLCLMHESEERGVLLLNGQPMPEEALARVLGLDKHILTTSLSTLVTFGVASRRQPDGALVSRRMVRDENTRKVRSAAGKQGGNPVLLKQIPTTRVKQIPTPSSSSSSSSSSSLKRRKREKGTASARSLLTLGEFGRVRLTATEHDNLKSKLNGSLDEYIAQFDRWVNEAPNAKDGGGVLRKNRHAYESILRWYERALKEGKVKRSQTKDARLVL